MGIHWFRNPRNKRLKPIFFHIKLTRHILRTEATDPMRQVSFIRNSATPYTPAFRRPGRPQKNWLQTSLAMCWNKLKDTPFTNDADQQQEIFNCALHRLF